MQRDVGGYSSDKELNLPVCQYHSVLTRDVSYSAQFQT